MANLSKASGKTPGGKTLGGKTPGKGHGQKTSTKAKGDTKRRKPSRRVSPAKQFSRLWLTVPAFAAGLTAIVLVWVLHLAPPSAPLSDPIVPSGPLAALETIAAPQAKPVQLPSPSIPVAKLPPLPPIGPTEQMRANVAPPAPATVRPGTSEGRVYEVFDNELLEQKIKEVDLVLVQTILGLELDPRRIRHLDIQVKSSDGQKYHAQSLAIGLDPDKHGFIDSLQENLRQWVEGAQLHSVRKDALQQEWRISLLNLPTHTLFLEFNGRRQEPPSPLYPPSRAGPRLAVIIDDLGENLDQAEMLASLSFPVTFAILPQSSKTREVAQLAAERGRDILLHQPMEPHGYPFRADPGPGALFVGMGDEEIKAILAENLAQMPQAIGVNNHMGSRFTADAAGMFIVLQELKNRGLFFLDSLTTSDSVALAQARRVGLLHLQRHIFLDNIQDVQAILFQLRKAERITLSFGEVVAIGHPHPETLEALKIWEKERDQRIQIVSVRDLLSRPALAGR